MCLLCLFSAGLEEVHVGGDGSYSNGNLVFTFELIFPSFPTVCSKDLAESSLGDGGCVCTVWCRLSGDDGTRALPVPEPAKEEQAPAQLRPWSRALAGPAQPQTSPQRGPASACPASVT